MTKSNKIAFEIYNYLKANTSKPLPEFSFQLGLNNNNCLIFTLVEKQNIEYYCNYEYYYFNIRLYAPKMNHSLQLDIINEILINLMDEKFHNLLIDNKKIKLIRINNKPNPKQSVPILESYTDSTQCYNFELDLILGEQYEKNK